MSNLWKMVGKPVKADGIQYAVTHNSESGEYAINPFSMANAGRLSQVRVTADSCADSGLPDAVKKVIRTHTKSLAKSASPSM